MNSEYEGVIAYDDNRRPIDYLYRVSLNALIKNEKGKVLVVKESGRDFWDLPGGGMDHGEDIKSALARELHEEVGMEFDFTYRVVLVDSPEVLRSRPIWQLRIIFEVKPDIMEFKLGKDGDEVKFLDPEVFNGSNSQYRESKIYEYMQRIK